MSDLRDFGTQPHKRAKGSAAEQAAVDWLLDQGYAVVERNAVTHAGEIDVVARDGDTLCFVEVKARSTERFGPAIAAVGPAKQRRLARCAALYLVRHPFRGPCRFDVLGLDLAPDGWRFALVKNAFPAA